MANSVLAKQQNGQFQVTLKLPLSEVKTEYDHVLKHAAEHVDIPGFRKGKAPLKKVEEKVDLNKVYEDVLQKVLPKYYAEAIKEHSLKPVINPRFEIVSTSMDDDWQVRATCAEMPKVDLGDYKKEMKGILKTTKIWTPDKGDKPSDDQQDKKLSPEELKQKQSQQVTEWLLKNVKVQPPEIMVTEQANTLLARLLDQVQKLGLTLDQYLASTNKKIEDVKAEYAQRATQEIRMELIVSAIGIQEKIEVKDEEVDKLITDTKDEKLKQNMQKPEFKNQLRQILFRQKVLDLLLKLAS